jgi:glycosyltransferase involved in cell wall biosynthesis
MLSQAQPQRDPRISCLICAFNEAPRISAVLDVVTVHPMLSEIIVVDDGSTDTTADVVGRFPNVRLVSSECNRGKSSAMALGVAAAQYDLLMLLDADLIGLDGESVAALALPVLSGEADISLSLRRNSLLIFRLIGLDFVSGERVVPRVLLSAALHDINLLPRFGIEMFMNRRIIDRGLRLAVTRWAHVSQARKTAKLGYRLGLLAECRMLLDLLTLSYPFGLVTQSRDLLKLRVKTARYAPFKTWIVKAWHRTDLQ